MAARCCAASECGRAALRRTQECEAEEKQGTGTTAVKPINASGMAGVCARAQQWPVRLAHATHSHASSLTTNDSVEFKK